MYAKFINQTEIESLQFPFEFEKTVQTQKEETDENGEISTVTVDETVTKSYTSSFDLDDEAKVKIAELGYKPLVQRGKPMSVYPLKRVFEDQGECIFGSWVEDKTHGEDEEQIKKVQQHIRARREVECFPIINRGELWYGNLTSAQKAELSDWYTAWLNAPETLEIPTRPEWLK